MTTAITGVRFAEDLMPDSRLVGGNWTHPLTKTQITWAGSGINKTTTTIGHVTEVAIETMTTENAGDRGTDLQGSSTGILEAIVNLREDLDQGIEGGDRGHETGVVGQGLVLRIESENEKREKEKESDEIVDFHQSKTSTSVFVQRPCGLDI